MDEDPEVTDCVTSNGSVDVEATSSSVKEDSPVEKLVQSENSIEKEIVEFPNEVVKNEENNCQTVYIKSRSETKDIQVETSTMKNVCESVEEKLNHLALQNSNGTSLPMELTEEDNLHGLAIPAESEFKPKPTGDNSVDSTVQPVLDGQAGGDDRDSFDHAGLHEAKQDDCAQNEPEVNEEPFSNDVHNDSDDSSSKNLESKPKREVKEKLNQEMQDMMHKNIEKFSPKKEPKTVANSQPANISDSSIKVLERPKRVNPFNHVDPAEIADSDIWQVQQPMAHSSISLQGLSSYGHQPHPSFRPVSYSTSEHSFLPHQMTHTRIPGNFNAAYPHHVQFDLMPPASVVRPSIDNSSYFEDVDTIVKEAKIRNSHGQQNQAISDPWVKMDQIPDDPVPTNAVNSSAPPDEFDRPSYSETSPNSCEDHQAREVPASNSSSREHKKRDANRTLSYEEQKDKDVPLPPSAQVRPLIEAAGPCEPEDLIEGIIFTAHYLGSTQLQSERNPGKNARMMQAQEAVGRIKAPEGESQPSVEVDLFISTDKVKILNADTQETIMDHTLRSISYIADIGKLLVIMAKRRAPQGENQEQNQIMRDPKPQRSYRVICHVFSSHDAQLMAQAIGQAFSVAYQQFLTANGIEPQTLTKDDYNQLLDMQEMYHDDLVHYSKRENIKDIWVEKNKGENLGVVIVESGWGSIVPTMILANLQHGGPAERCQKLSIGDQIMTVNGTSLVGLPLATCQSVIKGLKSQSIARLNIITCPPVVTVLIKRPDLKYQLGFSVQDGIICSLMRGGIAERGGVRVGHRIIEINSQSVVATPHDKIVHTLVSSVGEIQMKTMPAMMYRLLTGQEQPVYI